VRGVKSSQKLVGIQRKVEREKTKNGNPASLTRTSWEDWEESHVEDRNCTEMENAINLGILYIFAVKNKHHARTMPFKNSGGGVVRGKDAVTYRSGEGAWRDLSWGGSRYQ